MIRAYLSVFVLVVIVTTGCSEETADQVEYSKEEDKLMWPELSEFAVVAGRPAVEDDIKAGHATFFLQVDGQSVGQPLDIELPQYINHIDSATGEKTLGILIQAEETDASQIVGFIAWPSRKPNVATLQEIELLGIGKPE